MSDPYNTAIEDAAKDFESAFDSLWSNDEIADRLRELKRPEPDFSSAREIDREELARAIIEAWQKCKEIPFQLYDREAEGMADSILSLLTNTTGGRHDEHR